MSFITSFFIKPSKPSLVQPARGTFTIDRQGHILASTLPTAFQTAHAAIIAGNVLTAFRSAEQAGLHLTQLVFHYAKLKIVACEQRGGALIFLTPR